MGHYQRDGEAGVRRLPKPRTDCGVAAGHAGPTRHGMLERFTIDPTGHMISGTA
jgi:hypothetical protein